MESNLQNTASTDKGRVEANGLVIGYGKEAIMAGIDFTVESGEIFFIIGGSGSGKSTLLKTLVGLIQPLSGTIHYNGVDFVGAPVPVQSSILRRTGILYQGGALFSSMNLLENVALPLRIHTDRPEAEIETLAQEKLSLVELGNAAEKYPHEISGGMMKRAGLARALALDPDILFFDEPSAGLDPITSRNLDETILELNRNLGTTVIVVSHELESLYTLANRAVFLDAQTKKQLEIGDPKVMKTSSAHDRIRQFLNRESSKSKPQP